MAYKKNGEKGIFINEIYIGYPIIYSGYYI